MAFPNIEESLAAFKRADAGRENLISNSIANNCFVQVLIDGDGAYFHDVFFADGAAGGAKAASLLHTEIKKHVESIYPGSELPVMVNMYASLGGIAGKLVGLGVLQRPSAIHDFTRGFNTSQDLFNIIDVGAGKEKADHKVRGPRSVPAPTPTPAKSDTSSWATATKAGPQAKNFSIAATRTVQPAPGTVYYVNASDERIDAPLPNLKNQDREELKAITRSTKLCNKFYLGRTCSKVCPYNYSHAKQLTPGLLNALRHQARAIVCKQGSRCYDETCYVDHSCPNEVRSGNCEFDEDCFSARFHGADLKPAYKYFPDGTHEVISGF
ncbi:hypothetical protein FKW77_008313 [Venturia effusa]|uniref:C3H1-type domain-containing protein n=1 Tax=Venturia effusa TaxID=50376 RepID=A0A517LE94_9PEZI|nr:hypothetical protein FKW77_008313 [Venturia effusa]